MPTIKDIQEDTMQLVMLNYRGGTQNKLLQANRSALAKSCPYFHTLLEGQFKEKDETCININLGEFFSSEVFESVVTFIESSDVDPKKPVIFYVEMLYMSRYFILSDLADAVESVLIKKICFQDEVDIHTIANIFDLRRLKSHCEEFERNFESNSGKIRRDWPRCAIDGHSEHWCLNCPGETRRVIDDENWDSDGIW